MYVGWAHCRSDGHIVGRLGNFCRSEGQFLLVRWAHYECRMGNFCRSDIGTFCRDRMVNFCRSDGHICKLDMLICRLNGHFCRSDVHIL